MVSFVTKRVRIAMFLQASGHNEVIKAFLITDIIDHKILKHPKEMTSLNRKCSAQLWFIMGHRTFVVGFDLW